MPAPDETGILTAIDELIEQHTPGGEPALFEWDYLLHHLRRRHQSTTPAIRHRMLGLTERGALVPVTVSHAGYVYPNAELSVGMWSLYFRYDRRREYDPQEWGLVTTKRQGKTENLWANGNRHLYTTKNRFDAMNSHFITVRDEYFAKQEQKREEGRARFWAAAEEAFPDARGLMSQLRRAVPDLGLTYRLSAAGRLSVELNACGTEQFTALLTILQRGLKEEEGEA